MNTLHALLEVRTILPRWPSRFSRLMTWTTKDLRKACEVATPGRSWAFCPKAEMAGFLADRDPDVVRLRTICRGRSRV